MATMPLYKLKAFFYTLGQKGKIMSKTIEAVSEIYAKAARHNIKAYQIADAAGVTRVTLSNWRNGRSAPTLSHYLAVCDALDMLIKSKEANVA